MTAKAACNRLFAQLNCLPFDAQAARQYAELPFQRARFDRLTGAHARAMDTVMVTVNMDDFADIEGLAIQEWTQ